MKKIVFGITSLTLGGAERVLVDLANSLCERNDIEITIFTIYAHGELEKQLRSKVKLKSIYDIQYRDLTSIQKKFIVPIKILLQKGKIYKKYIQNKYDTEIAFLEGPITRIFANGKEKDKKIAWVHNDITKVYGKGFKAKLKKAIDEKIYSKYGKLVFVSEDNLEKFKIQYVNDSEKLVIYNYIDAERIKQKAEEETANEIDENETSIVTVARLVSQKALDRLIKVHAKLIAEKIYHKLYIIGEGPERDKLDALIKQENCQETAYLLGAKENPYPYMKKADYVCLLSNYEGYPMTLVEAKILNKNILITDTAAREVVKGYSKSCIFENSEEAIYEGLENTLKSADINQHEENDLYNTDDIMEEVCKLLEIKR